MNYCQWKQWLLPIKTMIIVHEMMKRKIIKRSVGSPTLLFGACSLLIGCIWPVGGCNCNRYWLNWLELPLDATCWLVLMPLDATCWLPLAGIDHCCRLLSCLCSLLASLCIPVLLSLRWGQKVFAIRLPLMLQITAFGCWWRRKFTILSESSQTNCLVR